jgi:hypothetical protein
LEIITPYASTFDSFISVFLTEQGNEYIITDGGWVHSGIYREEGLNDEAVFLKIFEYYRNTYDIKDTQANNSTTFYYLKASSVIDIPSKIFDLSTFIQSIVSISEITFESKKEKETVKRFVSQANDYLKSFTNPEKLKLNEYLNPDKKEIKFNALYYKTPGKITLVNYITGSTQFHFSNSIFKANTLIEMAQESAVKAHIAEKVSVIDSNATGYIPEKIGHFLLHLENHTGSKLVNWSEREKLQSILN